MFLRRENKIIKEMSEVFTIFKFSLYPVLGSTIFGTQFKDERYYRGLYHDANIFDDVFNNHEVELYFKVKFDRRSNPINFSNFVDNIAANIIEKNIDSNTYFMSFSNQSNDTGYIVNIHNLLSSCNITCNLTTKENRINTRSNDVNICTNITHFENEYLEGSIKYLTSTKKHKATIFEKYMNIMFKK